MQYGAGCSMVQYVQCVQCVQYVQCAVGCSGIIRHYLYLIIIYIGKNVTCKAVIKYGNFVSFGINLLTVVIHLW